MYARYGATAWVVHVLPCFVPFQSHGCGASHTCFVRHAAGSALAGEMLFEDGAIIIFLLTERRVYGETLGGMCHLLVSYSLGRNLLQGVNPRIAYAVAELLLLSPRHLFWQHILKRLTHDALLHGRLGVRTIEAAHLSLGIGAHSHVKEFLVEERHTSFHAPRREALVGTQTVILM